MVTKKVTDLSLQPVDAASAVPLYHQVEKDLQRLITSGKLQPEDGLPPEIELARAYGVGRHTMRMALARLTSAGWIARQAGRGTFVKHRAALTPFYINDSFTRQMLNMGRIPQSKVIHTASGVIDENEPAALHGKLGAPYFHLVRLRFGDDLPIVVQYAHIITELCPGLENFDFNRRSLYDVLSQEYRLVVQRLTHTMSAVAADRQHVEYLQVKRNTPLLLVRTNVYLDSGEIIEHTISYYRVDHYEYTVTRTSTLL